MPNIDLRFVWQNTDAGRKADARAFWLRLGVLNENQLDERAAQLCALAYRDGKLAGLSTVDFFDFPRMRGRYFYYRTTVAPEFRKQRIASRLCRFSYDRLHDWACARPLEKMRGLVMTFESADLFVARRAKPVIALEGLEFVFVGFSPDGEQIRVIWFPDAAVE